MQKNDSVPFFSVVIPTYNRAHTLLDTINSVLTQTFADLELIVVDDGSTDQTKELVREISDHRVKYIETIHAERSVARNIGIEEANGTFLCFLDSDDQFLPNHLSTLYSHIEKNPSGSIFRTGAWLLKENQLATRSIMEVVEVKEPFPFECMQTFTFHKKLFRHLRFDERFVGSEDLHFLLQAGLKEDIVSIPSWTVVYHVRLPFGADTRQADWQTAKGKLRCIDDILTWNHHHIVPYLRRHRCLSSLQLMRNGLISLSALTYAIRQNLASIARFPISYFALLLSLSKHSFTKEYTSDALKPCFQQTEKIALPENG